MRLDRDPAGMSADARRSEVEEILSRGVLRAVLSSRRQQEGSHADHLTGSRAQSDECVTRHAGSQQHNVKETRTA